MSQGFAKITLICDANVESDIENALTNSGVQFTKEEVKEPIEAHVFHIPSVIWTLSVALHILDAKKEVIKGNIELQDGTKYELTQEGMTKLNELLVQAMSRKREETATSQIEWWSPFIPEIREFLKKIIELMDWYPKAMGKGKRDVTLVFVGLIGAIVIGMWLLTYFDKVSGDSFVFVIGALIGYIFAFLQRYLGILTE